MRRSLALWGIVAIIGVLASGCNLQFSQPDTAAVQTGAALTVEAALTGAAPRATFTPQPFPTVPTATSTVPVPATAPVVTPTTSCDAASFITDVTYPDGTEVNAGGSFTKTWRLKNVGSCSWTPSYALVFTGGEAMAGPAAQSLVGNVNPGQTVDLSVTLTGPAADGTHTGNWGLRNAAGVIFSHFYVQVSVGAAGPTPSVFSVTHVGFTVTGTCGNFHTVVSITTSAAGTVDYHKVFSDGGTDTQPGSLTFASAGTQSFSFDNSMSAPHTSTWIDIYIDSPNHQQFGRATYTCP